MTGRYNYGTAAGLFARAGYKTCIFGKWHLDDNYPMRTLDKGFAESLVHGGGLSQPSPSATASSKKPKYCTGIFFREAIQFIERHKSDPFFLYLPTNAPHTPLEIEDKYVEPFRGKGLDSATEKVYGVVKNLDDNVGLLLGQLKRTGNEPETNPTPS